MFELLEQSWHVYIYTFYWIAIIVLFCFIYATKLELLAKDYLFIFLFFWFVINFSAQIYTYYYLISLSYVVTFILSVIFLLKIRFCYTWRRIDEDDLTNGDEKIFKSAFSIFIVLVFLELIYPDFNLYKLINPPSPDLHGILTDKFYVGTNSNLVSTIVGYLKALLFPFAFCYAAKKSLRVFIIFIFSMAYIKFINSGYISRGEMLSTCIMSYLVIVNIYEYSRKPLLIIASIVMVPVVIFFDAYTQIRLGADVNYKEFSYAFISLIESQSDVSLDGIALMNQGDNFSIFEYFKWLTTLAIPKFLLPDLDIVNISYSASSKLLGLSQGDKGFFILLPGLLAESYYIFSDYFLVSAFISALIFCLFYRFISSNSYARPFVIYAAVFFTYNLCRAGVTSAYPLVFNQALLLYIYVLYRQHIKL